MIKNEDVTIKFLADSLGISKQAIRRYFDQLPPSLMPIKKSGAFYISPEAQRFIRDKVLRVDTKLDSNMDIKSDKRVDIKLDTSSGFDLKIIEDKNEQIISLKKQIEKLYTLLDQQQKLTLQSNKQIETLQVQLSSEENKEYSPELLAILKETIENHDLQLTELKNEMRQKDLENTLLKQQLDELSNTKNKSFFQRLFS